MLGLKLIHVSKRGHRGQWVNCQSHLFACLICFMWSYWYKQPLVTLCDLRPWGFSWQPYYCHIAVSAINSGSIMINIHSTSVQQSRFERIFTFKHYRCDVSIKTTDILALFENTLKPKSAGFPRLINRKYSLERHIYPQSNLLARAMYSLFVTNKCAIFGDQRA